MFILTIKSLRDIDCEHEQQIEIRGIGETSEMTRVPKRMKST